MSGVALGVAAIGAGASMYGANKSAQASKDAMRASRTEFTPFTTSTPGGGFTGIDPENSGNIKFDLGDLESSRTGLVGIAQGGIGAAGQTGLPPEIQAYANRALAAGAGPGDPNAQMLGLQQNAALQQLFGNQFSTNQLQQSGFARGLQDTSLGGANLASLEAGFSGDQARSRALDLMRQQARPFEDRAFQDLQENQFMTGQRGTSGGGLQTEAFARGLGQADTARQLQAGAEGRAVTQSALQRAQGLSGIGLKTRGVEDSLLQNAFSRFSDTQGMLGGLGQRQFDRNLGLNELNRSRAMQDMSTQMSLAQFAPQLQSMRMQPALQALQAQAGLQDQALQPFQAALNMSIAKSNAEIGQATNQVNLASDAEFGQNADAIASLANSVGEGIKNSDIDLGKLFGGGTSTALPASQPAATGTGGQVSSSAFTDQLLNL